MGHRQLVPNPAPSIPVRTITSRDAIVTNTVATFAKELREIVLESAAHLRPLGRAQELDDLQQNKPCSIDKMTRLLVLCWSHPRTPAGWPQACALRIAAALAATVCAESADVLALYERESTTQATADVPQIHAVISGDLVALERARDATAMHAAASQSLALALEQRVVQARQRAMQSRVTRRPQLAASRS